MTVEWAMEPTSGRALKISVWIGNSPGSRTSDPIWLPSRSTTTKSSGVQADGVECGVIRILFGSSIRALMWPNPSTMLRELKNRQAVLSSSAFFLSFSVM